MEYKQSPQTRQGYYGNPGYQWPGSSYMWPPFGQMASFPQNQSGGMFPPVQTGTMFPSQQPTQPTGPQVPGMLPIEQSYIENIFRLNKGKLVTVYAMFDTVNQGGKTEVFKGIVEAAGRDHLIISDPETGRRVLLPMVYFGYAVFDEELEYEYPFAAPGLLSTQPPR